MSLKVVYENEKEVPEKHRELYSEKDGKWELTAVEGLKTEADIQRQLEANRKEREAHKATKALLAKFDGIDPEELPKSLDELKELRALKEAGALSADPEKHQAAVEAAVTRKLAPVQRDLDKITKERDAALAQVNALQTKINNGLISDEIRKAAGELKVRPEAVEDALLFSLSKLQIHEDGVISTEDGSTARDLLSSLKESKPHWWPPSVGGGATGSGNAPGGHNPWAKDQWNLTAQGQYLREHGPEKAAQLAKLAGAKFG